jgi:hypothetical protein
LVHERIAPGNFGSKLLSDKIQPENPSEKIQQTG